MATFFAFRNHFKTGVITANSAAPNMPPTNLSGDICSPSLGWQTPAGVTSGSPATIKVQSLLPAQAWRAFALTRTNLTSAAQVIFTAWLSVGGSPATQQFTTTVSGPAIGSGQVVVALLNSVVADYITIQINDSTNPDNFINIPGAYAGDAWIPLSGISWASTSGRDVESTDNVTRGGQEYPQLKWTRRRWAIALEGIRQSEMWTQVDVLRRVAGTGTNVLFIPNHSASDMQQEATFGILKSASDISFPGKMFDRRAWQATITERL